MSKFDDRQEGPPETSRGEVDPRAGEDANCLESEDRREALKAVRKYAMGLAGTSTVILSADEALAQEFCSRIDADRNPWLYYFFCGGDRPDSRGNSGRIPPGLERAMENRDQRFDRSAVERFTRP